MTLRIFTNLKVLLSVVLTITKVEKNGDKVCCQHNMIFAHKCSNSACTVSTRGKSITESCDEYITEMSFYIAKSSQLLKTNWETGFRRSRCSEQLVWYKITATTQVEDDCYTHLLGPFEEELLPSDFAQMFLSPTKYDSSGRQTITSITKIQFQFKLI